MQSLAAVILAAGQGTRMKSALPKVLHSVGGQPLITWSLQAARSLSAQPIVVVVGYGADQVKAQVGNAVEYTYQEQRLGTGHAVMQARGMLLGRAELVMVLYGDMPCLRPETLARLVEIQRCKHPALTLLSVRSDDSMGFGRVVRNKAGCVQAIVEEAVASPEILALKELNCGVYCFNAAFLWEYILQIPVTQPKDEYYLTDMVGLAVANHLPVEVLTIDDASEVQGINTRVQLANSELIMRRRTNERLMLDGVTLIDPTTTYVDAAVNIGQDTVILPNTHLQGDTHIGQNCVIGPHTLIRDSIIGNNCTIISSVLEQAQVDDQVHIGPFGHLRPGAHLGTGVHMGNFGEVKNAYIGADSFMSHFSYVGDAKVGAGSNIAAGTVTCNFNGKTKNQTVIGEQAFIGSGTLLIAPVSVGSHTKIGAGSIVTHDIPDNSLAYGSPARVIRSLADEAEEDV
ncbi:MAG: bifunctional UDP-N-acetylglucosamine diphosphorylase/glucosamine-1-phosphate N-acetyltransferase GlmU [Chloroflexi bacterium]|nr:bifunctional UDP-N-acetylglucosamine diphosphorylase/glucosamine-1-phosphate N-acetyltransferase GlmU [Chloroflexota bacterium]